jgi:hypothetical protein
MAAEVQEMWSAQIDQKKHLKVILVISQYSINTINLSSIFLV